MDLKLIELLICPVSQGKLELDRENKVLISKAAGLVFPIRDDIPIMLESEAIPLETWEQNKPNEAAEHFANIAKQEQEQQPASPEEKNQAPE